MCSEKWKSGLAAMALISTTLVALAQETLGSLPRDAERTNLFTQACANRDIQLVTLIEDHGVARDVAPEKLLEANFAIMRARKACAAGRESEATALYDDTALRLTLARTSR
jgi:hypothetical protein